MSPISNKAYRGLVDGNLANQNGVYGSLQIGYPNLTPPVPGTTANSGRCVTMRGCCTPCETCDCYCIMAKPPGDCKSYDPIEFSMWKLGEPPISNYAIANAAMQCVWHAPSVTGTTVPFYTLSPCTWSAGENPAPGCLDFWGCTFRMRQPYTGAPCNEIADKVRWEIPNPNNAQTTMGGGGYTAEASTSLVLGADCMGTYGSAQADCDDHSVEIAVNVLLACTTRVAGGGPVVEVINVTRPGIITISWRSAPLKSNFTYGAQLGSRPTICLNPSEWEGIAAERALDTFEQIGGLTMHWRSSCNYSSDLYPVWRIGGSPTLGNWFIQVSLLIETSVNYPPASWPTKCYVKYSVTLALIRRRIILNDTCLVYDPYYLLSGVQDAKKECNDPIGEIGNTTTTRPDPCCWSAPRAGCGEQANFQCAYGGSLIL